MADETRKPTNEQTGPVVFDEVKVMGETRIKCRDCGVWVDGSSSDPQWLKHCLDVHRGRPIIPGTFNDRMNRGHK